MSGSPQEQFALPARDEVAEQRRRHAQSSRLILVPTQRLSGELSEPEREQYELRMDAYEVQLEAYRVQVAEYVQKLDAAHHDGLTGAWLRTSGISCWSRSCSARSAPTAG